jgi:hypothetical protein
MPKRNLSADAPARVTNPAMMKKPPAPSADLRALLTKPCWVCGGSGWECERHSLRAMEHDGCGAAGKPCRCNPEALALFDDD